MTAAVPGPSPPAACIRRLPLDVTMRRHTVGTGVTLSITLRTAPSARVDGVIEIPGTAQAVLARIHGRASRQGYLILRLYLRPSPSGGAMVSPSTPVRVILTARTACGSATRVTRLTIPLTATRLPWRPATRAPGPLALTLDARPRIVTAGGRWSVRMYLSVHVYTVAHTRVVVVVRMLAMGRHGTGRGARRGADAPRLLGRWMVRGVTDGRGRFMAHWWMPYPSAGVARGARRIYLALSARTSYGAAVRGAIFTIGRAADRRADRRTDRRTAIHAPATTAVHVVHTAVHRQRRLAAQLAALPRAPGRVAVDHWTDRAFVADERARRGAGAVIVLDARTRVILRTVPVGRRPVWVAVDEQTGCTFVVNRGSDSVSILDAGTGRVRRTVTVGRDPVQISIDEQAGRAFVVNHGNSTVTVLDAQSGDVLQTAAVSAPDLAAPEIEMLNLINVDRGQIGLAALSLDGALNTIAQARSQDMIDRHYFSHHIPGGGTVATLLDRAAVPYTVVGENIALNNYVDFYSLERAIRQTNADLMNSREHRANLLEPRFTHVGLGMAFDQDSGILILTQVFVQP